MKLLTRKSALIALQLLTAMGIITGMACGFCMLWEMSEIYVLEGRICTMSPENVLPVLRNEVEDLLEDGIEYGVAAGVSLSLSLLTSVAAAVLSCFVPSSCQDKDRT